VTEIAAVIVEILENTWHYLEEAAPWLLMGFLFAGLLRAFVSSEFLFKHLGGRNIKSISTATLIGIPLPLCSCGVIPAGVGLYKQGASRASTLAFFIATPATTITTILIVLGMLGWKFALAEIIACFGVAILTGLLALVFLQDEPRRVRMPKREKHPFRVKDVPACEKCRHEFKERIKTTFRYGFIDMVDDVGPYIIVGLLAAGIIAALIPLSVIQQNLGGGLLPLIVVVLIAAPIYVCSAASVPFIAALIAKGMSPAAGLVFLIAGPATNLSTIFAIGKSMGRRTALLYITSIVVLSVLIAYGFQVVGWL
jgi:uncharacterized membrane protein YraQ (UPF0718 family)